MELYQTLENVLSILLILGIIGLSSYVTDEIGIWFYEIQKKNSQVFDLAHEFTPDLQEYGGIVNLVPLLFLLTFLVADHSLISEFLKKYIFLIFIRSFTILLTILPKHEQCSKRFKWSTCMFGQCYDKIFSGHTAFTMLAALLLIRNQILPQWLGIGFLVIEVFCILLTRSHYSIDVFFAMIVTYLVYQNDVPSLTIY
jgi:hypothetical protein